MGAPSQNSIHLVAVGRQASQSVAPADDVPPRHVVQQVVAPEEEMRQVPCGEPGRQLVHEVREGGHHRVTLPARSQVDGGVESVEDRRPHQVGAQTGQRLLHPDQSLEVPPSLNLALTRAWRTESAPRGPEP